jgi:hypothetical protein
VQKRVASDPSFGEALLREGIDTMLAGDVDTGKAILRDYIKATAGFEKLGEATGTQPKSLIRMFGPRGNPQARNRHCHAAWGLRSRWRSGSQGDEENQLSRLPISARDHPAGDLALSPVHTKPT